MNEELFFLEMPYYLSSWHKWAHALYRHAERYEHNIFDWDAIEAFCVELEEQAKGLRNAQEIRRPDYNDLAFHGAVSVGVGSEFSFRFIKVTGRYGGKNL